MNTPNCNTQSTPLSNSLNTNLSTRPYSKVTTQHDNSLSTDSYNLCNLIRSILQDYDLSMGASRLLVFLVLSCGRKGYTYLLIDTIAQRIRTCRTSTKKYIYELERKNRIRVIRRPGRSSIFQIVGIFEKSRDFGRACDRIKEYVFKNKTVSKPEPASPKVFCLSSPEEKSQDLILDSHAIGHDPDPGPVDLTLAKKTAPDPDVIASDSSKTTHHVSCGRAGSEPLPKPKTTRRRQVIRFDLVRQILELTRDHKSLGFWIKLVRNVDPETICYLLSSLRLAMASGQVEHRGRYLVGIVRRVCPWVFEIQSKKQALRASQQQMHGQMSSKQAQSEPVQEPDFDLGLEQVRRIRELLGRRVA